MSDKSYAYIAIYDDNLCKNLENVGVIAYKKTLCSDRPVLSKCNDNTYYYNIEINNNCLELGNNCLRMINYVSNKNINVILYMNIVLYIHDLNSNHIHLGREYINLLSQVKSLISFDIYRYDYYNEKWNTKMNVYFDCEEYGEYYDCFKFNQSIKDFLATTNKCSTTLNINFKMYVSSKSIVELDAETISILNSRNLALRISFN